MLFAEEEAPVVSGGESELKWRILGLLRELAGDAVTVELTFECTARFVAASGFEGGFDFLIFVRRIALHISVLPRTKALW